MKTFALRSASLLAVASLALAAHAVDAFSNLTPAPVRYNQNVGTGVGDFSRFGLPPQVEGFRFATVVGGTLTGFQVAMNNLNRSGNPEAYTLRLYTNSATNTLDTLLGTYSATSTGVEFGNTASALSIVSATGGAVTIQSGAEYWLVASSGATLSWNATTSLSIGPAYDNGNYPSGYTGAFSMQVTPAVTSTPGPLAALPFALIALRRRKKA